MTDLKYGSLVKKLIERFEWAEPATEGGELFPYGSGVRRDLEVGIDEILSGWFDEEVQKVADKIAHDTFEARLLAKEENYKAERLTFRQNAVRTVIEMFEPPSSPPRTVSDFVRYGQSCLQSLAELEDEALREEMDSLANAPDEEDGPSGTGSEG